MIHFDCPSCASPFEVPERLAGKTGRCKVCGGRMTIPSQPGRLPRGGRPQSDARRPGGQPATRVWYGLAAHRPPASNVPVRPTTGSKRSRARSAWCRSASAKLSERWPEAKRRGSLTRNPSRGRTNSPQRHRWLRTGAEAGPRGP